MAAPVRVLICSDIHYASEAEQQRRNYELNIITNPLQRMVVHAYRHFLWLRNPFAHNALLQRVLNPPAEPDWAVANGDYSCDSAFIGVADDAARQSASECLGQLRARFKDRFFAVFGDHELGKISLCGGQGGLRLKSLRVAQQELSLEPIWTHRIGRYVLVGITSSLAAMQVYVAEALPQERAQWEEISRQHLHSINAAFNTVRGDDRILLFCHDPTALPFLLELPGVQSRLHQIERTVIGHLHSTVIYKQSRLLSGVPRVTFCGAAVRRMSSALAKAKSWKKFNVLLCPSLSGLQLTRKGGYYMAELDPDAQYPGKFELQVIKW